MSGSPPHMAEALAAGGTVGLAKPFDVDELLALLTEHCPH
jgi:hypothetical protein